MREKTDKITNDAKAMINARQVGQALAKKLTREAERNVQRDVDEGQRNAKQRLAAGNKAREIAKELSKDDGD